MSYEPPMNWRAWLILFAGMAAVIALGVTVIVWVTDGNGEVATNGATSTTDHATTTTAPTSTIPTTTTLETPDDFRRLFVELMNLRTEIFTTAPDPNRVAEYASPFAGEMWRADRENMDALQAANQRFATANLALVGVRFEAYDEPESLFSLSVVVDRVGFQVLDANGAAVEAVQARGRVFLDVGIQRIEGEWRIVAFLELPIAQEGIDAVIAQGVPEV
ncbi:MAG: hypothetical protein ACRD29_13355 [Acidimicrobiales bacterium]